MFSSKSFIVSGLTFRSLIHFEFIFVYGVRKCSNFILLPITVQFSQHHLLKRLSFQYCVVLLLCHWLIDHGCMGLILSFLSCSTHLYFYFYASTILFRWLKLCSILWSQEAWFIQLHFSFLRLLWLFGILCVSIQILRFFFISSVKNAIGSLI